MTIEEKPHILLIDGMALLFRSFFRDFRNGSLLSPNDAGVPTNGVQGFARHTMTAMSTFQTNTFSGLLGYGCAYIS